MSKDIHKWTDGKYILMFDEHTFFVFDNEKEKRMTALQATEKLNEQQAIIEHLTIEKHQADKRLQTIIAELKKENEQLKTKCDALQKKTEMDKNDFFISEAKRMTLLAFIRDKALQKEYFEWERRIYDE